MKISIDAALTLAKPDAERLAQLQEVFAAACNVVSPVARQHRCWNRVALHHLTYHVLRQQFPALGSQMACNAVYAVCRACRLVYQGPDSPFNVRRTGAAAALPLITFGPRAPVYYDRHTLAIKQGEASIFTLEGRLRCRITMTDAQRRHLDSGKVQETALFLRHGSYCLEFRIETDAASMPLARRGHTPDVLPDHVQVQAMSLDPDHSLLTTKAGTP